MTRTDDHAAIVCLPPHRQGDRWPASVGATPGRLTIGPILIDGATPDAPLDRMRFSFRNLDSGALFIIDSEEGEGVNAKLVIDDDAGWSAHIPECAFLPEPGEWEWDAEIYDNSRTLPLTIYKGRILVTKDVRH